MFRPSFPEGLFVFTPKQTVINYLNQTNILFAEIYFNSFA